VAYSNRRQIVIVLDYDEVEDWVVLELMSGTFSAQVKLYKESELPNDEYPANPNGGTISIGKEVGVTYSLVA